MLDSRISGATVMTAACLAAGVALAQATPAGGTPAGAKLANPVPSSAQSIAAGREIFQTKCAPCHGPKGDGEGATVPAAGVKPADLTRAQYAYGTNDGDVFTNIKNGILPDLNMPTWDGQISDSDIWNLVDYLKSIRKKG